MRKLFVILLLGLIFNSCKEDELAVTGSFTFNGTTYSLDKGFIEFQESFLVAGYTYKSWGLTLASEGITYNGIYSGTGEVIYINLLSPIEDSTVPEGIYLSGGVVGDNLIELAETYLLIDTTIGGRSGEIVDIFVSGDVIVTRDGDFHIIEFNLTDSQGRNLSGNLTAPLQAIN